MVDKRILKRLNRRYIIDEIEALRQGFRSAADFTECPAYKISMEACHLNADRLIAEMGGEPIRTENGACPDE